MTGEELREAIKCLGISQGELARRLHVRPETVNRWINGLTIKGEKKSSR